MKSLAETMPESRPVIAQLVHTLNVGGAEVLAGNLARRLWGRYEFVFFCLDEPGFGAKRLQEEGFTVETIGRRNGLDWRCPLRLSARLRHHHVDLIQAHQYTPFFYAMMARLRYRRPPVVFTEHGRHFPDFPRPKRKVANRLLMERRDRVIAVGPSVKVALMEYEGIPDRRIDVILNGIDTDRFTPSTETRADVRAELGIESDDYLVMMVARLDPIKDHFTAIRACTQAAKTVSNLKLLLVGDGPEREAIEKYITQEGLSHLVQLLGTRSDVPRLLSAADTLLLTSVSEGIPLTIIEAMATGLPVVSTKVGSIAEVIANGSTGFLAEARDHSALAERLIQLGRSAALRIAMGDQGRARAVAEFSESQMAERYASLFDELLGVRKPSQLACAN